MSEHANNSPAIVLETHHYQQAFQLLMRAPVAICMLRLPDFVIELANPHMLELWDRDASAIGKKITEVFTEVDQQGFSQMLAYVVKTGNVFHENERAVTIIRNGKRDLLYVNFVFQPHYDEAGNMIGVLAVANEVTTLVLARKKIAQAEETTRLAVDAAHLGTYEINLETQEIMVSPRFNQVFGLENSAVRADYANVIHPDDQHDRLRAHEESLKTGTLEYEARVIWQDKTEHWIKASGKVLYDNHHKPVRLLGIVQDITEQKTFAGHLQTKIAERTRELELANQQLARSNAELEQFAFVTSHDLQEPLRKIQMFSSVLLGKSGPKIDRSEYIRKIADSAKRMTTLITDLLDFSRLAQPEPVFSQIDLNKVLTDVLADFELLIQQKQANVTIDTLAEVPGIPSQINQLFYNLLGNSLKFSDQQKQSAISISGRLLPGDKKAEFSTLLNSHEYFEITISDNGIGFDQQYVDRIFVVFQRLNASPDYSGHGIGLAICKKIIANHNGIIYAKGSPGDGAVFTVILPLHR